MPRPICVGTQDSTAFVVFEYLSMGGTKGGDVGYLMGKVRNEVIPYIMLGWTDEGLVVVVVLTIAYDIVWWW